MARDQPCSFQYELIDNEEYWKYSAGGLFNNESCLFG